MYVSASFEDVDIVVGFLAETTRPHGFAISETQLQIFIINASRRLFSDRFFTSSFRPEFYTTLGIDWVTNNGPGEPQWEAGEPNGHRQEVSPLKRVLLRAMPELAGELSHVINAFDPWARDRGAYYSLQWTPRPDAASDPTRFPEQLQFVHPRRCAYTTDWRLHLWDAAGDATASGLSPSDDATAFIRSN